MKLSVAIDGPAGAGKSTIAKMLANRFNLIYINTGAMYRAITLKAIEKNILPQDKIKLLNLVENLNMIFKNDELFIDGENVNNKIYLPNISNNVSNYAAIPEVREKLAAMQKKIAEKYNVVMDGRDIGTVVLKDAPIKFYLTASCEERAKRRYNELSLQGISTNYNEILNEIIKRDYMDSNRENNPLKKADDAILIDSSNLSIDDVVNKMSYYIQEFINKNNNIDI